MCTCSLSTNITYPSNKSITSITKQLSYTITMINRSLWQHPFWKNHTQDNQLFVTGVPEDVSLSLWSKHDIFLIHPSPSWDLYTLTEWANMYERHGLNPSTTRMSILNDLLKSFPLYQDDPLSTRFAKALWLALWSNTKTLWIHPSWLQTHRGLQQYLSQIIHREPPLDIQWILCNQQNPISISWRQLHDDLIN